MQTDRQIEEEEIRKNLIEKPISTRCNFLWISLSSEQQNLIRSHFPDLENLLTCEDESFVKFLFKSYDLSVFNELGLNPIQNQLFQEILNEQKKLKMEHSQSELKLSLSNTKIQEIFINLISKEHVTENDIKRLSILSELIQFISDKEVEIMNADKDREARDKRFKEFAKYIQETKIVENAASWFIRNRMEDFND